MKHEQSVVAGVLAIALTTVPLKASALFELNELPSGKLFLPNEWLIAIEQIFE